VQVLVVLALAVRQIALYCSAARSDALATLSLC